MNKEDHADIFSESESRLDALLLCHKLSLSVSLIQGDTLLILLCNVNIKYLISEWPYKLIDPPDVEGRVGNIKESSHLSLTCTLFRYVWEGVWHEPAIGNLNIIKDRIGVIYTNDLLGGGQ